MDIRSVQKPLKDEYRKDPNKSRITLTARGGQTGTPVACSVDIGRAIYQAQAHTGVGGAGTAACSGALLQAPWALGTESACQWVAGAVGKRSEQCGAPFEGFWYLRG